MLRDLADQFKPTIFLTIHSGALAMWSPYSYAPVTPTGGGEQVVLNVLKSVNGGYCNCNVGNAGAGLGAITAGVAAGTCLDYMWDVLHTPYAMAFEIYSDSTSFFNIAPSSTSTEPVTASALEVHQHTLAHTPARHSHSLLTQTESQASCFSSPSPISPHVASVNDRSSHANSHASRTLQPAPGWDVFLQQQQKLQQDAQQQHHHAQTHAVTSTDAETNKNSQKLIGIFPHVREGPYDFDETLVSVHETSRGKSFPPPSNDELAGCLKMFNPTKQDVYKGAINHWSETILVVFQQIIAKHAAVL